MPRYIISYDLRGKKPDYKVIEKALDDLGAERLLQSVWAVKTDLALRKVYNKLLIGISKGDGILVSEVIHRGWIGRGLESDFPKL